MQKKGDFTRLSFSLKRGDISYWINRLWIKGRSLAITFGPRCSWVILTYICVGLFSPTPAYLRIFNTTVKLGLKFNFITIDMVIVNLILRLFFFLVRYVSAESILMKYLVFDLVITSRVAVNTQKYVLESKTLYNLKWVNDERKIF